MSSLVFAVMAGLSCGLSLLLYLPPRGYGVLQLPYFMLTFLWGELALYNIFFQALSMLVAAARELGQEGVHELSGNKIEKRG